jgi:hypothetical protein
LPFDGTPRRARPRARHGWFAGTVLRGLAVLLAVGVLILAAGLGRIG